MGHSFTASPVCSSPALIIPKHGHKEFYVSQGYISLVKPGMPDSPASISLRVAVHGMRAYDHIPALGQQLAPAPVPLPWHHTGTHPVPRGNGTSWAPTPLALACQWSLQLPYGVCYERSLHTFLFYLKESNKKL